jgi:gas vesicle protein
MSENSSDLLVGLLFGGLIGAALGILYAPKSGRETRDEIVGKTKELLGKAKEEYEEAIERSKAAYESAVKELKGPEISEKEKV